MNTEAKLSRFRIGFILLAVLLVLAVAFSVFLFLDLRRTEGALQDAKAELGRLSPSDPEAADVPEASAPAGERDAAEILGEQVVICHALGELDGKKTLNCLEGFLESYKAGVRVFEADFRLTSDDQVVLRHDWKAGLQEGISGKYIPTLEEFLSTPILGTYTPLSFRDLLKLMEAYPDICVITDTKFTDEELIHKQFRAMVRDAQALGLSYLFDRMEVQVYSERHFVIVNSIHPFKHYIYTLYQDSFEGTEKDFRKRVAFAAENGIEAITIKVKEWNPEWISAADESGIKVYVHTVNDPDQAARLLEQGVSAVYSDSLLPSDFE